MSKKRASAKTVMAFMQALYPTATHLAIAALDEETVLKHATSVIQGEACLRQQIAAELTNIDVADAWRADPDLARIVDLIRFAPGQTTGFLHDSLSARKLVWDWVVKFIASRVATAVAKGKDTK